MEYPKFEAVVTGRLEWFLHQRDGNYEAALVSATSAIEKLQKIFEDEGTVWLVPLIQVMLPQFRLLSKQVRKFFFPLLTKFFV